MKRHIESEEEQDKRGEEEFVALIASFKTLSDSDRRKALGMYRENMKEVKKMCAEYARKIESGEFKWRPARP